MPQGDTWEWIPVFMLKWVKTIQCGRGQICSKFITLDVVAFIEQANGERTWTHVVAWHAVYEHNEHFDKCVICISFLSKQNTNISGSLFNHLVSRKSTLHGALNWTVGALGQQNIWFPVWSWSPKSRTDQPALHRTHFLLNILLLVVGQKKAFLYVQNLLED